MYIEPALRTMMPANPVVASIPRVQAPAIPDDLVYATMIGPDSLTMTANSPVLRYGGVTYWAFSFLANDDAMAIVAYTAAGVQRQRWDRGIARYLWQITTDPVARTVSFHGQRRRDTGQPGVVTMFWDELVPAPPRVSSRPKARGPAIPPGLMYSATYGPDSLHGNPNCPVLRFGDYTYWAYTSLRNDGLGIVAYDCAGKVVRQWAREGARYVWEITVDGDAQTVCFHGQRQAATAKPGTVTMSWDELWIS